MVLKIVVGVFEGMVLLFTLLLDCRAFVSCCRSCCCYYVVLDARFHALQFMLYLFCTFVVVVVVVWDMDIRTWIIGVGQLNGSLDTNMDWISG